MKKLCLFCPCYVNKCLGGAALGVAPVPLLVLPPIFALTMTLNKKHFYLGNDKKN